LVKTGIKQEQGKHLLSYAQNWVITIHHSPCLINLEPTKKNDVTTNPKTKII